MNSPRMSMSRGHFDTSFWLETCKNLKKIASPKYGYGRSMYALVTSGHIQIIEAVNISSIKPLSCRDNEIIEY